MATWTGQPSIRGKTEMVQMTLLTFNSIGITFTWGLEMTYCTPYLLSLGLSKSNTSLVWVAGPLSGLIVQPIIGVIADESTSKWGRRRPFMVVGSIIVALCLMVLGFTQEIVAFFCPNENEARPYTIFLAVLSIYAVDFAINAVMSCARSLIVDTLPIEKQQLGAAWHSRMAAMGHLIGYAAGAADLAAIFGSLLGDSQFKQLIFIASFCMLTTTAVTCWAVEERILVSTGRDGRKVSPKAGLIQVFHQIWSTLQTMPPRVRTICHAQFWSWIGWFPFLFYGTTWVGETYFRYDVPQDARESKDVLGDVGRIGSTALVIYSAVTFLGTWLLPMVVKSPDDHAGTPSTAMGISSMMGRFSLRKPDLLSVWICGHITFASAMCLAPFATSFRFATMLIVICGLPWAVASWAPTAFLGVEVNRLNGRGATGDGTAVYQRLDANGDTETPEHDVEMSSVDPAGTLQSEDGPSALSSSLPPPSSAGELSGVYFGILNIYTTLPQFIGTFISAIVFTLLEPGKSPELATETDPDQHHDTDGLNAISVCLFIGSMSAAVAAVVTRKLKDM